MTPDDDNDHRRYIFQWHPLPQPPWERTEISAWDNAIVIMKRELDVSREQAEAFVRKFGEVVEVVE